MRHPGHRFLWIAAATAFGLTTPLLSSAQQSSGGTAPPGGPPAAGGGYSGPHGPGMMGGYYGGGMGPGMMGGYYGGGMGPGMMGGYHGRYGPGMMGGYRGPCGPGMMEWRPDALGLSRDQTAKIDKLRDEGHKKHWELAGKLMDENAHLRDLNYADRRDPAAIGRQYAKVQDIERQMLEQSIDTDNRIESLLTNEQRTRLRSLCR